METTTPVPAERVSGRPGSAAKFVREQVATIGLVPTILLAGEHPGLAGEKSIPWNLDTISKHVSVLVSTDPTESTIPCWSISPNW